MYFRTQIVIIHDTRTKRSVVYIYTNKNVNYDVVTYIYKRVNKYGVHNVSMYYYTYVYYVYNVHTAYNNSKLASV